MEQARGIIVKTLTILAGFWLSDLAAARVQAGIAAGESMKRIIDGMTIMLQHPLALGFDRASLLCGLGGACAVGLFHLYRWSMRRNWRDGEEYGSARWSTSREMAPYTDRDTRQNLQMTATEGLSLDAPATRRNLNTAVIGGSGSGKTATHVIPNILKGSMNYACTDPKGELYAKTGGKLKTMGYTVKQLDLVDLTSETKFNPMRYIDPTKPDVAIMRLVTNIMDNTNGSTPKEHQTDDFWTKSERSLLTALTAFVYYLPDDILKDCLHIDTGQTLNAVADMRDLLEASEQDETKESQVDAVARTATEIYEETRAEWEREDADHDDPDLREAWRLAQGLKFAARQYRPFTQGAGETKKGIIISLGVRLAPLTVDRSARSSPTTTSASTGSADTRTSTRADTSIPTGRRPYSSPCPTRTRHSTFWPRSSTNACSTASSAAAAPTPANASPRHCTASSTSSPTWDASPTSTSSSPQSARARSASASSSRPSPSSRRCTRTRGRPS